MVMHECRPQEFTTYGPLQVATLGAAGMLHPAVTLSLFQVVDYEQQPQYYMYIITH